MIVQTTMLTPTCQAMQKENVMFLVVCLLLNVNMDTYDFPNFELGDLLNFDSILPDCLDIIDDDCTRGDGRKNWRKSGRKQQQSSEGKWKTSLQTPTLSFPNGLFHDCTIAHAQVYVLPQNGSNFAWKCYVNCIHSLCETNCMCSTFEQNLNSPS